MHGKAGFRRVWEASSANAAHRGRAVSASITGPNLYAATLRRDVTGLHSRVRGAAAALLGRRQWKATRA